MSQTNKIARKQNRAKRRAIATRKLRLSWGAERVYLAWIRTAIALMALGFLIARLGGLLRFVGVESGGTNIAPLEATIFGMILMGLGGFVSVVATWRFHLAHRNISRGKVFHHSAHLALLVGVLTALVSIGLVASFAWVALR